MTFEWLSTISLGQIGIILTLVGGFGVTARKVTPILRRMSHLIDDVVGEPARPGVAARPGILERMAVLEVAQAGIASDLKSLASEVHSLHTPEGKEASQ